MQYGQHLFPDEISEGWQVEIALNNLDYIAGFFLKLLFTVNIAEQFKVENTSTNLTPFGRLEVCFMGVNLLGAIKPLCWLRAHLFEFLQGTHESLMPFNPLSI